MISALEQYAERAKKKDPTGIQVVYSIGGYIGKNLKISLVTDEKLKEIKSHLDRLLYCHVYSVQKGKLAGFSLLYNSNLTELKRSVQQCSGYSGVSCQAARLKTPAEIQAERPKAPASKIPESVSNKEATKVKTESAVETQVNEIL